MHRALDVILAGAALIAFAPLLLAVMVMLRFSGEGEVFYVQTRIGRRGRPFGLIKFATMLKNSPNMATGTVTVRDDPRVLPLGRILRQTKVNELPQLINVIVGDMSVIGPRPQTQRCFDAFPAEMQPTICTVRPGLSGVGSIVFRNEEAMLGAGADPDRFYNEVIMPYKGALEIWYVQNQSLAVYLACIGLTLWSVATRATHDVFRLFPDLPRPPAALRPYLGLDGAGP